MKKIITGIDLQNKMKEAIDLLCNTVKQTLGPKGNNVIIDHSNFSPFITNDGVTIAQNVESEEEGIATILEIAKESSIRTNDIVGDGTTTTLVLLQSLFQESLRFLDQGISPILLKKELDQTLQIILHLLSQMKRQPTKKMLKHIASVSANDEEIGSIVSQAFQMVKEKSAIVIQENENFKTTLTHFKGYSFSSHVASPFFFRQQNSICYEDALLVMVQGKLIDLESIQVLLNQVMDLNQNLILIANQYDEYFVNEILALVLDEKLNCCLLQLEDYGMQERMILEDLEVISNGKIMDNILDFTSNHIGYISNIMIQASESRIDFLSNESITQYVKGLKKKEAEINDMFQKSFYLKRIAMFTHGIMNISIGGPTKTECREKRMRFEDAICAVDASLKGVLPGSGISLLKIEKELKDESPANIIWKETLRKPFQQILLNSGCDEKEIFSFIVNENYNLLYNVATNQYENCLQTKVIDPYEVVKYSLIHSCSIAGMLLTTTSLVINERTNHLEKESDYTEL